MAERFEDQYMDVLQNIETAIIGVYRQHPEMADRHVEKVLEGLIRAYNAEKRDQPTPELRLAELERTLFVHVKAMCDWRMGHETFEMEVKSEADEAAAQAFQDAQAQMEPLTPDEVIACLKRIRKSVRLWNKHGGQRGYLGYIDQFFP